MKPSNLLEYVLIVALVCFVAFKVFRPIGRDITAVWTQTAEKLGVEVNGR